MTQKKTKVILRAAYVTVQPSAKIAIIGPPQKPKRTKSSLDETAAADGKTLGTTTAMAVKLGNKQKNRFVGRKESSNTIC